MFDQPGKVVTTFQLQGKPIAKMTTFDDVMYFKSEGDRIYDFSFKSPIKTGTLEIETKGKCTFHEQVQVRQALVTCKALVLNNTFSSEKNITLDAACCDNNGSVTCSNFLFKGTCFNVFSGSTFVVQDVAYFPSLESFYNGGEISFNKNALINTSSLNNTGKLTTENFNLTAKNVVNQGSIMVKDSFVATCELINNQNNWSVGGDCCFKKVGMLLTSKSSRWHVGNNWQADIKECKLEGSACVGSAASFNVGSHVTLSGPLQARILQVISKAQITCTPQARMLVSHYVGLKANGWIQYDADTFKDSACFDTSKSCSKDKDERLNSFPSGVFLHSEQSGIKKSGNIIALNGTVAMAAKKTLAVTGLTDAGFNEDATILMKADSLHLDSASVLKALSAHLTAQDLLEQYGKMLMRENASLQAPKVVQGGLLKADNNVSVKTDNFESTPSSNMETNVAQLQATASARLHGKTKAKALGVKAPVVELASTSTTQADTVNIDAPTKAVLDGTLDAKALQAESKSIHIGKKARIKAEFAKLKAQEVLKNLGELAVDNLEMRAKYVENYGTIKANMAHIKADRWWWNNGNITVQEALTIDALLSLDILGYTEAKELTINAVIDINLLGCRLAQNSHVNSLVGLDAGFSMPKINSVSDLFTYNNFKAAFYSICMRLLPPEARLLYSTGKALLALPDMCKKASQFYEQAKKLYGKDDIDISDWIPLLCGAKDLAVSTLHMASTLKEDFKNVSEKYKKVSSKNNEPKTEKSNPENVESNKDSGPEETKSQKALRFASQSAQAVAGALLPHSNRSMLVDVNLGARLGCNGHSSNLLDVSCALEAFIVSRTVDTCHSYNTGVRAAGDLKTYASRTATNKGQLAALTGAVVADDINLAGRVNAKKFIAKARKKASVSTKAEVNKLSIEAQMLELDTSAQLNVDELHVDAKTVKTRAKVNAKNKVALHAQLLHLGEESHVTSTEDAISIVADHVTGEAGNRLGAKKTAVKAKTFDNRGSVTGPLSLETEQAPEHIGTVEDGDVEYKGPTPQGFPDKLVDANNDLLKGVNLGKVAINPGQSSVEFEKDHDVPHGVAVKSDASIEAKRLKSKKSLDLKAAQDIKHKGLEADVDIDIEAGRDLIAISDIERNIQDNNYQDVMKRVSMAAGNALRAHAGRDAHLKAVTTSSGQGGTQIHADRNIVDEAQPLTTHKEYGDSCSHRSEKTEQTDVNHEVSRHTSQGELSVRAGNQYIGQAPVFDANKTTVGGTRGSKFLDVHDTKHRKTHREKKGSFFESDKKTDEEESTYTSRGVCFKGEHKPVIEAPEGTVLLVNPLGNAPIVKAAKTDVRLGKHQRESLTKTDKDNFAFQRKTQQHNVHEVHPELSLNGVIEIFSNSATVEVVKERSHEYLRKIKFYGDGKLNVAFVNDIHDDKCDKSLKLTKAASAALAIAVTLATGGVATAAGAGVVAALGVKSAIASAIISHMTAATITSLSVQAAQALIENEGDIVKAAKMLASMDTLKSIALAATTAGLTAGADLGITQMGIPTVQQTTTIADHFASAAFREGMRSAIGITTSIAAGQEFKDALEAGVRGVAANALSATAAREIGKAYATNKIDPVTHKVLHAANGAVGGAIVGGKDGAIAGATGAAVSEIFADLFKPDKPSLLQIKEREKDLGRPLTEEEFHQAFKYQLKEYATHVNQVKQGSKLAAALTAFVAQQDVDVAITGADNALNNNFVILAQYGIMAGATAYTIYNVYNAYQEQGALEALKQLGIEFIAGAAVGAVGYKVGTIVYPTAKAAITVALDNLPCVKVLLYSAVDTLALAAEKASKTALGKMAAKAEAALVKVEAKVFQKVSSSKTVKTKSSSVPESVNDYSAAIPIGKKGDRNSKWYYKHGRTQIKGREYSGHAIERMQERGIMPSMVENTIKKGFLSVDKVRPNNLIHYDSVNQIQVVTDKISGRVVSVQFKTN